MKPLKLGITLPAYLVEQIDQLADEVETFRSEVISMLVEYCFDHAEIIDELFPLEEESKEEQEEEGSEESDEKWKE
jgi:metal-responsive CopG/Arc/MetJ family transcriptional regulator